MTPEEMKQIRLFLGLSQTDLAVALRLGKGSRRTIRRYEAGQIKPSGPVLRLYELLRDGVIIAVSERTGEVDIGKATR